MTTRRYDVTVTTSTAGEATVYTAAVSGPVRQVRYVPASTNALSTLSDLDITLDETGVVIAGHDDIGGSAFTRAYRQATHGADGSASLYAAGGEPVEDLVYAGGERIKVAVTGGGSEKSGTFYIYVG